MSERLDVMMAELDDWASGRASWWNNYAHDFEHGQERCAMADAMEVVKRSAQIQAHLAAGIEGSRTCPQCFGAGWVIDAKVGKSPTTLELIPCIYPDCAVSGREVAVLCLYGEWANPVLHPTTGAVMSLERFAGFDAARGGG